VGSVLAGRKRSRLRGRGLDFDELRHYRPGDDIRTMDWKITQRTGSPYVRVYTEERDRPVWLVIDQRLTMFFGSQHQMKSVAAAEVAALTAWRVLGVGDRIGAVIFNDQQQFVAKPSRSERATLTWFERLVSYNHDLSACADKASQPQALAAALKALAPRLGHDGLIIIVSDFDGWDNACTEIMKLIRRSNDVIATLISDPLERDIGKANKLVVSDGKHQLEIKATNSPAQARFKADYEQRLDSLTDSLKRHGVPVLALSTHTDIARQVQRLLGGGRTQ
jgi:uncharacterized protein (DUF58 family)